MKKIVLFSACALVALSLAFISCSDDDDDFGEAPKTDEGVITTDDGDRLLLAGISNYLDIRYDSDGKLTYFREYDVSYDPFEFWWEEDEKHYYAKQTLQFSFNDKGYATKAVCYESYKDDNGDYDEYEDTITASYDSDGHITKLNESLSAHGVDEGYSFTDSGTGSMDITWKNGNLTAAKWEGVESGTEYGYSYRWSWTSNYTFSYSDTENKYKQFVKAITFEDDDFGGYFDFGFLGYLGNGPEYLPSELSYETAEEEDDDIWSDSASYTYSYTLNNNGSINTEKENNRTYTYSYITLSDTRSVAPTTIGESLSDQDNSRHKSFASRLRERHKRHLERKNAQ